MRYLEANVAVKVPIGPFLAVGDGFTPETGVAIGDMDEAQMVTHDAAADTDISGYTWAEIDSTNMRGWYNITITPAVEGMLTMAFQDDNLFLPVFSEFMVLSQAAYASMFTAKDSGVMSVETTALAADVITPASVDEDADFVIQALSVTNQLDAGSVVVDATMDVVGQLSMGNLLVDSTAVVTTDATVSGNLLVTGTTTHTGVTTNTGLVTNTNGLASDITGDITGNLSGSIGSYTGNTAQTADNNTILAHADYGNAKLARTGADGDTLEDISDEIAGLDTKIGTIPALDGGAQNIGAAIAKLADDNGGADYDAGTDSLQEIRNRGDAEWITATAADIMDAASALTLDFGTLLERTYQLLNNEMNVTDADGSAALRNLGDSGDMATGSITDAGGTTSRAGWTWA